jgi:ATP-dependent DNA helicase RecG
MPEIQELVRLMSDLESDSVERKESISDRDKIRQAICAYANDLPGHRAPGYIFIGVNNAGNPVTLPITDQLQLTLSEMRSDGNIRPLPFVIVAKATLHGVPAAVVAVHPSDMPPVRLRGQIWIRVGPRRAITTRQEERVLTEH